VYAVDMNKTSTPKSQISKSQYSKEFIHRQEHALVKKGQGNAANSSRRAVEMEFCDDDEVFGNGGEDGKSVGGRTTFSAAASLHPSLRSTYSMACSEITIGAGDNTAYWDFQHRTVVMKDLGHTCRECKRKFSRIGEPLTERRGARTSMRYHAECFSGFADPRSQSSSSMHMGNLAGTQLEAAPTNKAGSKMRTGSHFVGSSDKRVGGNTSTNKINAFMGGSSAGFGAKSSKGKVTIKQPEGAAVIGGLSIAQLEEHTRRMEAIRVQPNASRGEES
jgi:hypothetical protein